VKRLVVTADDFGLSSGVVAGIVEAHEHGVVTSTSLMVNAPAVEAAFAEARRLPSLAVGLHFVLTFGRPVGAASPLAGLLDAEGRFLANGSDAHERATPSEVRGELRAQLEALQNGIGRPPSHIDGHHHVHIHPGILRAVIEEAGRLGIPVRSTDEAVRGRLRLERIRTPDAFVSAFYGRGNVSEGHLFSILDGLEDGTTELMCHPARRDPELRSRSSYVEPRYEELRSLTSPRVKSYLEKLRCTLALMSSV
jgi:predicted glycoside hydrolase/deacetylase ChbG (UPF0249 family)